MRYLIDFIGHFLSSSSRHGTHSPFVYALAEKAVYVKKHTEGVSGIEGIRAKYRCTLSRILDHLGMDTIHSEGSLGNVEGEESKRALLLPATGRQDLNIQDLFAVFDVVVVDGIYRSVRSKNIWEQLVEHPQVTVSVDFFYFGLLFHRKGQVKEHFKLRFPFWLERRDKL